MDRQLRTPIHARLFSEPKDSKVLIVTSAKASKKKKLALSKKAEVLVAASWASLLKDLGRRGIVNLLIEGGGEVIASALKARVVREAYFFVAPILIGGQSSAGSVGGLGIQSLKDSVPVVGWKCRSLGNDFLIHGEVDV
jgi:diaminohydroxyphosphoribosylaminopyrimidine deaminase/5-amino-6-(5-phosphoribosylamino)uracil reductase